MDKPEVRPGQRYRFATGDEATLLRYEPGTRTWMIHAASSGWPSHFGNHVSVEAIACATLISDGGPQAPGAVRRECPTHKRTWDEIKNVPGWACPSCLALDPGFFFVSRTRFCVPGCTDDSHGHFVAPGPDLQSQLASANARIAELESDLALERAGLTAAIRRVGELEARASSRLDRLPRSDPWRPLIDDWDLLPDA